jgi:hypothetical protein
MHSDIDPAGMIPEDGNRPIRIAATRVHGLRADGVGRFDYCLFRRVKVRAESLDYLPERAHCLDAVYKPDFRSRKAGERVG